MELILLEKIQNLMRFGGHRKRQVRLRPKLSLSPTAKPCRRVRRPKKRSKRAAES